MKTAVSAFAFLALVACGGGGEPATPAETSAATEPADQTGETAYSAECGEAMARAAGVDSMQDTGEETDPAFFACESLEEFSQASADYPDALDGTDPETYATNRCQFAEGVKGSPICAEVSE